MRSTVKNASQDDDQLAACPLVTWAHFAIAQSIALPGVTQRAPEGRLATNLGAVTLGFGCWISSYRGFFVPLQPKKHDKSS